MADRKGGSKGASKGKSRGKGSAAVAAGCASTTPAGLRVCFAFNNPKEGCNNERSKFEHVCGVCFLKGLPMFECRHNRGQ